MPLMYRVELRNVEDDRVIVATETNSFQRFQQILQTIESWLLYDHTMYCNMTVRYIIPNVDEDEREF